MTSYDTAGRFNISNAGMVYIGGEWRPPAEGGKIALTSPSTEQVYFEVAAATEPDMDLAVAAAREAFDNGPWPRMSPSERAGFLRKIAEGLRTRDLELCHTWSMQTGILFKLAQGVGARAAGIFDMYADMAGTFEFEEKHTPSYGGGRALLVREPVGVVAGIVPWNGPLELACIKVAPALLAGCPIVLKPSPEAPLDAYILAEIADKAGLPPGVFNLVPADRAPSEHLISNPGIDKVSFTGSSVAGRRIASIVADRMGRYTMELGGKSAAIILDDMDPAAVAQQIAGSLCLLSGQVCAALTRVIVPKRRHDEYVREFAAIMENLQPGDPYDDSASLGPLAMKRQLNRVLDYIEQGKRDGAELVVGGKRPASPTTGHYVEPTLFANVENSLPIAQEEIFGPVLCLIPAEDEDDAIRLANESIYGLNGAVFTGDSERAYRVARRVRTGNIAQNGFRLDLTIAFGGVKMSGVGREGGVEGLLPYLEPKTVFLD